MAEKGLSGPGVTVLDLWEKEKAAVEEFCREEEWVYSESDIYGSEADVSSLTGIVVVLSIHTGSCFAGGYCFQRHATFRRS